MQKFTETSDQLQSASLVKRLAAMLYDTLLVAAMWMLVGGIGVALNGGEEAQGPFFKSCLFLVTFCFFAGFWTYSGQTLGMQAWRIRLQTADGFTVSPMQALIRFFTAMASALPLGLGYWWMLFDKQGLTWHDRYSESQIVQLPKPKK